MGDLEVNKNVLIVESKNDKYFFDAYIKHLNFDNEILDDLKGFLKLFI